MTWKNVGRVDQIKMGKIITQQIVLLVLLYYIITFSNKVAVSYYSGIKHFIKLGDSSPECWLADSRGISNSITPVWQNMYFYCSNCVGNQFTIAIRHLRAFVVYGQYTTTPRASLLKSTLHLFTHTHREVGIRTSHTPYPVWNRRCSDTAERGGRGRAERRGAGSLADGPSGSEYDRRNPHGDAAGRRGALGAASVSDRNNITLISPASNTALL